jgi:hypothetical protein
VHAASLEELQRGRFRLEVVSVSRGAGVSTGRFLSVLAPADREALAAELADLPAADGNTVPAQLSFPPLLPESAHVTRAPQVLPTVISLQEHRAPEDAVLTPEDLAVGCDGRRMYLAAPERGHRVEAVGMHALNLRTHTPPLVRFLTELSRAQCAQVTVFDWGAAAAMPFLPRLRYGRTVLAPARWRLEASELPGRARPRAEWDAALTDWRARRRLPRRVHLVEDDRRLFLDLDEAGHRTLLRQTPRPYAPGRARRGPGTGGVRLVRRASPRGRGAPQGDPAAGVAAPARPHPGPCPLSGPDADAPPPPRCFWPPCTETPPPRRPALPALARPPRTTRQPTVVVHPLPRPGPAPSRTHRPPRPGSLRRDGPYGERVGRRAARRRPAGRPAVPHLLPRDGPLGLRRRMGGGRGGVPGGLARRPGPARAAAAPRPAHAGGGPHRRHRLRVPRQHRSRDAVADRPHPADSPRARSAPAVHRGRTARRPERRLGGAAPCPGRRRHRVGMGRPGYGARRVPAAPAGPGHPGHRRRRRPDLPAARPLRAARRRELPRGRGVPLPGARRRPGLDRPHHREDS